MAPRWLYHLRVVTVLASAGLLCWQLQIINTLLLAYYGFDGAAVYDPALNPPGPKLYNRAYQTEGVIVCESGYALNLTALGEGETVLFKQPGYVAALSIHASLLFALTIGTKAAEAFYHRSPAVIQDSILRAIQLEYLSILWITLKFAALLPIYAYQFSKRCPVSQLCLNLEASNEGFKTRMIATTIILAGLVFTLPKVLCGDQHDRMTVRGVWYVSGLYCSAVGATYLCSIAIFGSAISYFKCDQPKSAAPLVASPIVLQLLLSGLNVIGILGLIVIKWR
eukprot:m.107081 g.107081  ORF g.107081 m.107081 type:complete len:281 (+) comp8967_c0_seq1:9-851(+)